MDDYNSDYGYDAGEAEIEDVNLDAISMEADDAGMDASEEIEVEIPVVDIWDSTEADVLGETGALDVSEDTIKDLLDKSEGYEPEDTQEGNGKNPTFTGRKVCPTRHGCQGATNCNYSLADYHY